MKNDTACIASIAFWFKDTPFVFLPSTLVAHAISALQHHRRFIPSVAGSAEYFTYLASEHTASNHSTHQDTAFE
jgi:hypothetical protein